MNPAPAPSRAADARSPTLIVFLPGAQEVPQDIVREGFVDQVRARGIDADVVVADAHLGYFYGGVFEQRLREDVVQPARAQGYRSVWLAGGLANWRPERPPRAAGA